MKSSDDYSNLVHSIGTGACNDSDKFKDLLAQCPHHGIEKWRQCQILYDGLNYQTKTLLETMCQGDF